VKAVVQIAERGDAATIEILIPLLTHEHEESCASAVEALVQIAEKGETATIEMLISLLTQARRGVCL